MYANQIWERKKVNFIPDFVPFSFWFPNNTYSGTDFCSILPNLDDFYNFLPYIVQVFAVFYPIWVISFLNGFRSGRYLSVFFLQVPNLVDISMESDLVAGVADFLPVGTLSDERPGV